MRASAGGMLTLLTLLTFVHYTARTVKNYYAQNGKSVQNNRFFKKDYFNI